MKVVIDDVQYIPMPEPSSGKNLQAALDVRFDSDAGDQITVRDYFRLLLETLIREEESFSGKRPFGNSGWMYELYSPLAIAGFIECESANPDEHACLSGSQKIAARKFILNLVREAFEQAGQQAQSVQP